MELSNTTSIRVPETLSAASVRELDAALERSFGDPAPIVVLRGSGAVFCLGLDIKLAVSAASNDQADQRDVVREAVETFAGCLERIRSGPRIVLAVVQGQASGGGVGLAAACDGVLATSGATFVLPELAFGLAPAVILPYLAQRVSLQKVRWLALRSQKLQAEEALALGLVDAVCAESEAESALKSWLRDLRRVDPDIIGLWKKMTAAPHPMGSRHGVKATLERLDDPRVRESLKQFSETGEPPWTRRTRSEA